jgi:ATP synthase protein I
MDNEPDDQTPYVLATMWVSRITSIVLEMVLPGVLGYWVDQKLGTRVLFLIIGVILGFVGGLWQLIRLTKQNPRS